MAIFDQKKQKSGNNPDSLRLGNLGNLNNIKTLQNNNPSKTPIDQQIQKRNRDEYIKNKRRISQEQKDIDRFPGRLINGINELLTKILIITIILFLLFVFKDSIINFLINYPIIYGVYEHIKFQIVENTLLGLFYYCFLTSLFFIFIPIEVIYLYYSTLDHNIILVTIVALSGNILGLIFNYYAGRILGKDILKNTMGNKFDEFNLQISRWGGVIVFVGNIIIFPIEIASVVFGAARYDFKKFFWYSIFGKLIKFWILLFGKNFFISTIIPWLTSIF